MKKKIVTGILFLLLTLVLLPGCIYIGAPQIATFQSIPQTILEGEKANLIWAVSGAESVFISPDIGSVALAGNREVSPFETTTYTLTARNITGTSTNSLVVTVNRKVNIVSFEASPESIGAGGTTTLKWEVTGATNVTITPDVGDVAPSGSREVKPGGTITYTLTAVSGTQVLSKSIIVQVTSPPVIAQFTAYPTNIELGHSSTLSWSVSGATKVEIQPELDTVPASGTSVVFPNKTTVYVLTAESDCCVVNRSLTIQVAQYPVPLYLPVVNLFNIYPSSIYKGESALLQWDVANADSVHISGGIGNVPSSGSLYVSPENNTIYTLTANNIFGYRQVSVAVQVFSP